MNNWKTLLLALSAPLLGAVLAISQTAQPAARKAHEAPKGPRSVATSWQKVPAPPLHQFKPQQPRRVELANGMVIFLQEDHELPLIDGTIRIRGGAREETAAKA